MHLKSLLFIYLYILLYTFLLRLLTENIKYITNFLTTHSSIYYYILILLLGFNKKCHTCFVKKNSKLVYI